MLTEIEVCARLNRKVARMVKEYTIQEYAEETKGKPQYEMFALSLLKRAHEWYHEGMITKAQHRRMISQASEMIVDLRQNQNSPNT